LHTLDLNQILVDHRKYCSRIGGKRADLFRILKTLPDEQRNFTLAMRDGQWLVIYHDRAHLSDSLEMAITRLLEEICNDRSRREKNGG
jgi:hypothetical protein